MYIYLYIYIYIYLLYNARAFVRATFVPSMWRNNAHGDHLKALSLSTVREMGRKYE